MGTTELKVEHLEELAKADLTPDHIPKRGWFDRWRDRRAEASRRRAQAKHKIWEAEFKREFSNRDSMVHKTVVAMAMGVAHGMMMGLLDAKGISRCAFCISTDQLRKRIIQRGVALSNGKSTDKAIYCCPGHWETPIPVKTVENPQDGR